MTGASPVSASSTSAVGNRCGHHPSRDQRGRHDRADAGEGEEDRRIGVLVEQLGDPGVEGAEMLGVHPQFLGEQLRGERLARCRARCRQQMRCEPVDQHLRIDAAGVVLPAAEPAIRAGPTRFAWSGVG